MEQNNNNNQRIKDHDGGIVSGTTYVKYTDYLADKSVLFTDTRTLTKEGIEIRDKMIESDGGFVQFSCIRYCNNWYIFVRIIHVIR